MSEKEISHMKLQNEILNHLHKITKRLIRLDGVNYI